MASASKFRKQRVRILVLYGIFAVLPAIGLVWIAEISVRAERSGVLKLIEANRRIAGQRLTEQIERHIIENAENCMRTIHLGMTRDIAPPACEGGELFVLHKLDNECSRSQAVIARRLAEDLSYMPDLSPGRVYRLAYSANPKAQLLYTAVLGKPDDVLVMSVDLTFVATSLLPISSQLTGVTAHLRDADTNRPRSSQYAYFKELFPFWRLEVAPQGMSVLEPQWLWHLSYVPLVMGCVMAFSVVLMMRASLRQIEFSERREQFVSGFSHEFKRPAGSIILYAETLRDREVSASDLHKMADLIVREADRIQWHADNVIASARIDAGAQLYRLERGDLVETVRAVLDSCEPWISLHGFVLERKLTNERMEAFFDARAVRQALINLLENAVKYSDTGRRILVGVAVRGREGVIEIFDQGPGISKQEQRRIFERFYRAPGTHGKSGFGLGLFLVSHAMLAHRGRVELESAAGQGSCFRLVFPLCEES